MKWVCDSGERERERRTMQVFLANFKQLIFIVLQQGFEVSTRKSKIDIKCDLDKVEIENLETVKQSN